MSLKEAYKIRKESENEDILEWKNFKMGHDPHIKKWKEFISKGSK